MATFWRRLWFAACNNCGVRINAFLTTLIPVLDMARSTWPTLQEHLPPNLYSMGFVALAVLNVLLHLRTAPAPPPRLPGDPK